ncbi:MAG: hypothetical protein O3A25_03635 [Acidobacteria bacterium]|nr:hypothetical protein [Acidobacteriota bacterium]
MRLLLLLLALVTAVAVAAPVTAQPATDLTGGTGTLLVGGYPNRVFVVDEATEQVVADITMTLDGPPSSMALSEDRTRLYMRDRTFEQIEIMDVVTRRTIDTLTLSEGQTKVRIRNFRPAPDHSSIILLTDKATKQLDRFEIAPPALVQVDVATHDVVREIPWPDGLVAGGYSGVNVLFSPDGGLLYLFGDEIVALETDTFEEVERWELSQPDEGGVGRFNFGFNYDRNEEPGFYSGIFRVRDEVQNRSLMGVARINLAERDVDFYTLGPSEPVSSFALAPGGQTAYALLSEIGRYEIWTFDLVGRRLARRQTIEGRPRMGLATSTNGQILYIHQAGNTIDLYEAATYRYLRTITLPGDMSQFFVVPGPEAR